MTEEQMEMSLDDIIKAKPSMVKRGGRRQGGGGGNGGAGNSSGGARGRGSGGNSRGSGGGGRRGGNRPTPYSRDTPSGRWDHDKYEGGARNGKFGGRLGGASRGGTKLIISNLEYSVNDQDIRELFSEFGAIRSYSVHFDRSGRSLGTADVMYNSRTDATKALKTYNNVPLDGKPMFIEMVSDEPVYQPPAARPYSSGGGGGYNRSRGGNRGGRGQRRGGNGGGGGEKREKKKPMTAEELDAQLDEYKKTA